MSKTLTKADICNYLHYNIGLSKSESKKLVEAFLEEIKLSLEEGKTVKISGFGNFNLRRKKERQGCNPQTGEAAVISPRTVVTFKTSQKLKKIIAKRTSTHNKSFG